MTHLFANVRQSAPIYVNLQSLDAFGACSEIATERAVWNGIYVFRLNSSKRHRLRK
jgi:hypothetical protein